MTDITVASYVPVGRVKVLNGQLLPMVDKVFSPFADTVITADELTDAMPEQGYALRIELNTGRVVRLRAKPGMRIDVDELLEAETFEERGQDDPEHVTLSSFENVSNSVDAGPDRAEVTLFVPENSDLDAEVRMDGAPDDLEIEGYMRHDRSHVYAEVTATIDGASLDPITLVLPSFDISLNVRLRKGQAPLIVVLPVGGPALQGMLDVLAADAPFVPDLVYQTVMQDKVQETDVETLAHDLVQAKFASPDYAAAGGWYLLKAQKLDRVGTWTRNMADYFPQLSDGAALEGWRRLTQGAGSNQPFPDWRMRNPPKPTAFRPEPNAMPPDDPIVDATGRFIAATQAGVPLFASGVQRLAAGLDWCRRRLPGASDDDVLIEARARARLWSQALLPGTALTVLQGSVIDLELASGLRPSSQETIGETDRGE